MRKEAVDDYEVYKTKAAAAAELEEYLIWWPNPRVVEMRVGGDDVWVIQLDGGDEGGKFLRSDGDVR